MTAGHLFWLGAALAGGVTYLAYCAPPRPWPAARSPLWALAYPLFILGVALALLGGAIWRHDATQATLDACAARGGQPVGTRSSTYCVEPTATPIR